MNDYFRSLKGNILFFIERNQSVLNAKKQVE